MGGLNDLYLCFLLLVLVVLLRLLSLIILHSGCLVILGRLVVRIASFHFLPRFAGAFGHDSRTYVQFCWGRMLYFLKTTNWSYFVVM